MKNESPIELTLRCCGTECKIALSPKSFKRLKQEAKKRKLIIPEYFDVSRINKIKILGNLKNKDNLNETLDILLESSSVLSFDLLEQGNGVYTWKSISLNVKPKDQKDEEKIKQSFILKLLIYLVDFFKETYKIKTDEIPYMNYIKKSPYNKDILKRIKIKRKE